MLYGPVALDTPSYVKLFTVSKADITQRFYTHYTLLIELLLH